MLLCHGPQGRVTMRQGLWVVVMLICGSFLLGCAFQVRVCPEHALQLNYRKNKEALKAQRKAQKRAERKQQRRQEDSEGDEEPTRHDESSKRKKRRAAGDSDEHEVSGHAPGEPNQDRLGSGFARVDASHAGATPRGVQQPHEQQGRSRLQGHTQRRKDEKGAGKPDLEAEADAFLHEMFP